MKTSPFQGSATSGATVNVLTQKEEPPFPTSSAFWLAFFRLAFCFGISPFYFAHVPRNSQVDHTQVFQLRSFKFSKWILPSQALLTITSLVAMLFWTIAGESNTDIYFIIVDKAGDIARIICVLHVFWRHQLTFSEVMNQARRPLQPSGKTVKFATGATSGYVLYCLLITFWNSWLDVNHFYGSSDFSNTSVDNPLPKDRHALAAMPDTMFWLLHFTAWSDSLYLMFVDLFVFCTVAMYCVMVHETVHELSLQNGRGFEVITAFQRQIGRINACSKNLLLVTVLAHLPFYVLRVIPSFFLAARFNLLYVFYLAYVFLFFGSIFLLGWKHTKVVGQIRAWMENSQTGLDANRQQLLLWDLSTSENLALSLGGISHFNTKLFMSLLSMTVTYTLIVYQFEQLG